MERNINGSRGLGIGILNGEWIPVVSIATKRDGGNDLSRKRSLKHLWIAAGLRVVTRVFRESTTVKRP